MHADDSLLSAPGFGGGSKARQGKAEARARSSAIDFPPSRQK